MTAIVVWLNTDTTDSPIGTGDWTQMDTTNDVIIPTRGSAAVADGQPIPTSSQVDSAAALIDPDDDVIVSKYLLADLSANLLKEIHNAGNQNKRYVFGFAFDGATATEPVLELWDNTNMDTTDGASLGAGTPTNSWFHGVVTTDALPGSDWVGSPLAGSNAGNYLSLNNNNGALSTAKNLYCNLKIVIPAGATAQGSENPVGVVKWFSN
jgi:hypothetical protein